MISNRIFANALCAMVVCTAASPTVALAAVGDASASSPTSADQSEDLGQIVVTAQRRSENAVDVPITVNAVSAQQLQDANVESLTDITKVVTGVRFDNASMFIQPSIRGVGTDIVTSGVGSNVGIYVDGFYNPNPTSTDFGLLNVSGIQVLKGPQGTLFGRNATGGAILVSTLDPSETTSGTMQVSYGRFNTTRTEGYVTGGVTDKLAVDLGALLTYSDGYYTNVVTGEDAVDLSKSATVRAGVKYTFSDSVSALLRYEYIYQNDPTYVLEDTYVGQNGPVLPIGTPPGTYVTSPWKTDELAPHLFSRNISNVVQLTVPMQFNWGTLTSYTQVRNDYSPSFNDLAGTANSNLDEGIITQDRTRTQEFLATSAPGGPFSWTAGLFGFYNTDIFRAPVDIYTDDAYSALALVAPYGSSTTSTSLAAYADGTYEVISDWFLTAGVRYSHDTVSKAYYQTDIGAPAPGPGGVPQLPVADVPVGGIDGNKVTPRAVVRWKPTDASSLYASYTEGYKAAVLNVGCGCATANVPATDEKINAYEVGYKYSGKGAHASIAGFYYDYKDLQVAYYTYQAGFIVNAPKAHIEGLEAQGDYEILDGLTINADVSYLDAKYDDYPNDNTYVPAVGGFNTLGTINGKGLTLQRAPKVTANAGVHYTWNSTFGKWVAAATYTYTSKIYFDPADEFYQDGYGLLGLRAEWTDLSGRYTLAAYGNNVTNRAYRTTVDYNSLGISSEWAAPATWGISARVRF